MRDAIAVSVLAWGCRALVLIGLTLSLVTGAVILVGAGIGTLAAGALLFGMATGATP